MTDENPFARNIESQRKESSVKEGFSSSLTSGFKRSGYHPKREHAKKELQAFGRHAYHISKGLSIFAGKRVKRRAARTKTGQQIAKLRRDINEARAEIKRLSA